MGKLEKNKIAAMKGFYDSWLESGVVLENIHVKTKYPQVYVAANMIMKYSCIIDAACDDMSAKLDNKKQKIEQTPV